MSASYPTLVTHLYTQDAAAICFPRAFCRLAGAAHFSDLFSLDKALPSVVPRTLSLFAAWLFVDDVDKSGDLQFPEFLALCRSLVGTREVGRTWSVKQGR